MTLSETKAFIVSDDGQSSEVYTAFVSEVSNLVSEVCIQPSLRQVPEGQRWTKVYFTNFLTVPLTDPKKCGTMTFLSS